MAYKLEKEKTKTSPYLLIDEENNYMKLEGKSYLEDVFGFFQDINDWLDKIFENDSAELTFDCEMEYFNSSTTKMIFNSLRKMDNAAEKGAKITVNWIAYEDDEMIIECGEEFAEDLDNLTFNMVTKE